MSIIEIIKTRKSVRGFNNEPISSEVLNKLTGYISDLSAPFDTCARIELLHSKTDNQPLKLGTYGVISGANHFMALILKDRPMAEVGAGYLFEQAILYCTELGLGTCWLGGTLNKGDFSKELKLEDDEKLVIVSPVGYKRERRKLLDTIMRAGAGSDHRKPFEAIFFDTTPNQPLTKQEAGAFATPLEMVRIAPSASNKQPWRVVKQENQLHFYHIPNRFSLNDIGIALCHFELTSKELGLKGHYEILDHIPSTNEMKYIASWIGEN